MITASSYRVM